MGQAKIVFQPQIHHDFLQGVNQVVDAIRPTIGPLPRYVAIERTIKGKSPELLDNGGLIARRIVELPHRTQNTGAMLVRHLLWRLHETVGDGTATAAILFQSVYSQGVRYIAAGGDPTRLRQGLERGAEIIRQELINRAHPLTGREMLAQMARSICHDEKLAVALGEIFDVIGPFGHLDIRRGQRRGVEHEFIDGVYWKSGVVAAPMLRDRHRRALKNSAILISNLSLQDPHDLVPLMKLAIREGVDGLVIVAQSVSDQISNLLLANERPGQFDIIAVRLPGTRKTDQTANLHDLARLAGGRVLLDASGDSLRQITWDDLGFARRAWATKDLFGLVGGQGDARQLRDHVERLQTRYHITDDLEEQKALQRRIGHLLGGTAVLNIGGITESERNHRDEQARKAADALRLALHSGVLPGGGAGLRACHAVLEQAAKLADNTDERAAYRLLVNAVEAPMRQIVLNAGYEPAVSLSATTKPTHGFDVCAGRSVDMFQAGILDSAGVLQAVAYAAITSAAQALTTDVVIQRRQPPQAINP